MCSSDNLAIFADATYNIIEICLWQVVSPAVTLNICFYFSLCSIPFWRNRFGILWMRYTAVGTASSVRLFLPITLSLKGRICRKYTSSRRIKRDSRPLHLIKPNRYDRERSRESGHGEAIRDEPGNCIKGKKNTIRA